MDARAITKALGGTWHGRYGSCPCPAHADKMPSMKVRDDARKGDGIDVHCFAGCDWKDIKAYLAKCGLLRLEDQRRCQRRREEKEGQRSQRHEANSTDDG